MLGRGAGGEGKLTGAGGKGHPGGEGRRRAFTLVEMLVTVVLVGIGIVSVFGGIAAITRAETRTRDSDLVQTLAQEKWDELNSVTDPSTAADQGDFADQGYPDVSWDLTLATSAITNVEELTLVARRGEVEQTLVGLHYTPPAAVTTGAAGGTTR